MEEGKELRFVNVTKSYGRKVALQSFSCTFTAGITGILGPNGAGKSTMMHLLTDNIKRETGQILYQEQDILELGKSFRSVLGYMPQEQGLYDEFTGKNFLLYIAFLKGIRRKQAVRQIEELLELVHLTEKASKKIAAYSGGMRQRILFCQALLGNPEVVLLDEPTAGMDMEERIKITEYLEDYAKDKIVLWTTHIVSDIEKISSHILLLKDGRNKYFGGVEQLLENTNTDSLEKAYFYMMQGEPC